MKSFWFILSLSLLHINVFFAQTGNKADTLPKHHNLRLTANGSMNITPTDRVYLLNNQVTYGYQKKKVELNSGAKWIYGSNLTGLTNNDFTGSLDGNYYHDKARRLNSWILGSYTTSFSLNILNEYQIGLGAAYIIIDGRKNQYIYLRVSNGFMWEESDYINPEGSKENYSIIRNSLRVQFRLYEPKRKMSLESTTFWQPALNKSNDYNLRTAIMINIPVWKFFSLQTKYEYNFITRTKRENTMFTYGLTGVFKF